MKITETIERECCHPQTDLKPYQGWQVGSNLAPDGIWKKVKFCKHCGQLWVWERRAGELDGGLEKLWPVDARCFSPGFLPEPTTPAKPASPVKPSKTCTLGYD